MWIFTTYGFFSFTQSTYRPGFIQIRARDERDLEDLKRRHALTGQIIETEKSDYRWRLLVRPNTASRIVAREMAAVDYSNYKNATTDRMHSRPLMAVWSAMMTVQRNRERELGRAHIRFLGEDHRHLEQDYEPGPGRTFTPDLFDDVLDEDPETSYAISRGADLIDDCHHCGALNVPIAFYGADGDAWCEDCAPGLHQD